ncbi:hypothetical protein CCB80_00570 [Armatimonadetes bacterium Uphvl-Ar1]|nr:hypothetical protein CCB80_00570 [Armatimonadetes bacterium Uphvl-Ar1]
MDFDSGYEPVAPEVHLSRSIVLSPFAKETTRINASTLHLHASLSSNHLGQNKPTYINPQQINRQMLVPLPSNSSNHQIFAEATQEFNVVEQPLFTVAPKQIADIKKHKQISSFTLSSPPYYRKLSDPILQSFTHRFSGGQITGSYYQADAVAIQYQDHYKLISGQLSFIGSTVTQMRGRYGFGFTPTNLGATSTRVALGYNLKGNKFDYTKKSNTTQHQL